jgi:hypothetical protein
MNKAQEYEKVLIKTKVSSILIDSSTLNEKDFV